ncbi:hypothetical protein LEP1GSC058_2134 [Leptospira fainei serovar Hurstbridge str. BUT 6]|uniref:Uncharacterized protein n=1 Tax=Leptospira fainei serovar Hurstbridge str. BUT 6 TaxID=1193011 RepID=S3V250_9LEPT|nr:hypothetical protein LEP1GSC058_2134 [Leptospira fainei serovar Hurstbridge str. BUT 6]
MEAFLLFPKGWATLFPSFPLDLFCLKTTISEKILREKILQELSCLNLPKSPGYEPEKLWTLAETPQSKWM